MGALSATSAVFFALFAVTLTVMYLVIRREMAPIGPVTLIGTVINIVLVALISLDSGNSPLQVIFVGLAVGLLFSLASVSMAAYFRGGDGGVAALKEQMRLNSSSTPSSEAVAAGETPQALPESQAEDAD